jgi:hypothetical protein
MNSKGFKNFSKAGFSQNMGSNPRALLPLVLGGALAFGLFQSFYYGNPSLINS